MNVKAIISGLVFTVLISFGHNVYAQETTNNEVKERIEKSFEDKANKVETYEEATNDIMSKGIFSLFGKDHFDLMYINKLDKSSDTIDYQKLVAPFPYLGNFKFITNLIIFMSFLIFLAHLGYSAYKYSNKVQQTGDTEEKGQNGKSKFDTALIIFRFTIGFVLLTPFSLGNFHFTNGAIYITAKAYFASKIPTEILIEEYLDTDSKRFPAIKLPAISYNHKHIGLKLIDFGLCIHSQSYSDFSTTLYIDENEVVFRNQGINVNCSINLSFSLDNNTAAIIDKNDYLNTFFKNTYEADPAYFEELEEYKGSHHYKTALIESYKLLHIKIINQALVSANTIALPTANYLTRSKEEDVETSQFKEYMSFNNQGFEANCEKLYNKSITDNFTEFDRLFYTEHIALCLAFEITNSIVYPHEISNITQYLNKENKLADNQISLCSSNYTKTEAKHNYIDLSNSVSFEECFVQECGSLRQFRSNAYNCSSMVSIKPELDRDKNAAKLGFTAFGAIVLNAFRTFDNTNSRELYNKVYVKSNKDTERLRMVENSKITNPQARTANVVEVINTAKKLKELGITDTFSQFEHNEETVISHIIEARDTTKTDFYHRIKTCIEHPNSTNNGYNCNGVLQEYHTFGKKLMQTYVAIKVGEAIVRTVAHKKKEQAEMNLTKKMQNAFLKKVVIGFAGAGALSQLDIVNNLTDNPTDILNIDNFENENLNLVQNVLGGNFNLKDNSTILSFATVYLSMAVFDEVNGSKTAIFNVFSTMLTFIFFAGFTMSTIIPVVFLIITGLEALKIGFNILSKLFLQPLLTVFIAEFDTNIINQPTKQFIVNMLELMFQVIFYVVSLILVMLFIDNVLGVIVGTISTYGLFNLEGLIFGQELATLLISLIGMVLMTVVFWLLVNQMFLLVHHFSDIIVKVLLGKDASEMATGQSTNQQTVNMIKSYFR